MTAVERLCEKRPLSANALKYIAVIAMVIDHIGWAWVPTASVLGQLMHLIGRFTAPIMCFFIAEGYYHTRDVNKYLKRLFVFALISHFPFAFAEGVQSKPIWTENGSIHFNEELFLSSTGVIFTLFLGLMALKIWQTEENKTKKILAVAAICFVSTVGDWMFFAVLWVLGFGIYHGNFKKQLLFYYMVACAEFLFIIAFSGSTPMRYYVWQAGIFLAPLWLLLYNGERGRGGKFNKWFFYIFYPAHLVVIGILKWYIL